MKKYNNQKEIAGSSRIVADSFLIKTVRGQLSLSVVLSPVMGPRHAACKLGHKPESPPQMTLPHPPPRIQLLTRDFISPVTASVARSRNNKKRWPRVLINT